MTSLELRSKLLTSFTNTQINEHLVNKLHTKCKNNGFDNATITYAITL